MKPTTREGRLGRGAAPEDCGHEAGSPGQWIRPKLQGVFGQHCHGLELDDPIGPFRIRITFDSMKVRLDRECLQVCRGEWESV